jgi:hypothetical protein
VAFWKSWVALNRPDHTTGSAVATGGLGLGDDRVTQTPPKRPQVDGLTTLWTAPVDPPLGHPLNLLGGYQMTERLLTQMICGDEPRQVLEQVTKVLGPFSREWCPTVQAHNDFYDDQIIVSPDGELALVDFEEIGPGDPMLDVGCMLAHLRWISRFGNGAEAYAAYHKSFQVAALDRFGWNPQDLDLREAFTIFRLCPGPLRQLRRDWARRLEGGLALASEVLNGPTARN